jgi:hypothetical protein
VSWRRVARGAGVLALALAVPLAAHADFSLAPPALPGGVVDESAALVVVPQQGGRVVGLDLSTGQTRWTSTQGRWPLASPDGWVAVGAPDRADGQVLRVRFLRSTDGAVLAEAKPIRLPAVIGADASWEGEGLSLGTGNTSVNLSAWAPRPRRDRRLRIRWRTDTFIGGGGMRPPERGPSHAGLVFVDPSSGAVEAGPDDPAQGPEPGPAALPQGWRRAPGTIYWSWSWHGAAWTDKPRAFSIGTHGVAGFFSYESAAHRLVLNRFAGGELQPPVVIAAGGEWAPQVALDGRYLVLSKGNAGVETFTFFDLARPGNEAAAGIPWPHLEPRFRSPFAVIGPSVFYVAEGEGAGVKEGTTFPRSLVCVDWATGRVRWTHPLPPRVLPPPMAGMGMPR